MAQNRICSVCGTENEADFAFCKHCGTQLPPVQQSAPPTPPAAQSAPPQAEPVNHGTYTQPPAPTLCGALEPEVAAFVGPNAEAFLPKFRRIEQGASTSWNWPVFLFSFLLNIPFVWFFYRKMYKVGAAVLAFSLALTVATTVCLSGFFQMIFEPIFSMMAENPELFTHTENYGFGYDYDSYMAMQEATAEILSNSAGFVGYSLGLGLVSLLQLGMVIILPIFANKLYYNHCTRKLLALKQQYSTIPPAPLRLTGGTNTGAAVALGICVPIFTCILQCIPLLQVIGMAMNAAAGFITYY